MIVASRRDVCRGTLAIGASLAGAAALSACSGGGKGASGSDRAGSSQPAPAGTLQVFAANSLEKALPEVQDLYSAATGAVFADTQFRGSGDLVEQMVAGAQVDVLITASAGTMDDAEDSGLIDPGTRTTMFVNDLVIVAAEDADIQIGSLEDVASIEGSIAIGEPGAVPAGKYANQALASVGLYSDGSGEGGTYADGLGDRVNQANSVGTAAQYVASGECAIGFVYSSDIYRYEGLKVVYTVPAEAHGPIEYPGAVAASSSHADEAADFIAFCMDDEDAAAVWARYGFELASE